jgi:outer membrane protein OmpA-like peptidoglycan-associated protein
MTQRTRQTPASEAAVQAAAVRDDLQRSHGQPMAAEERRQMEALSWPRSSPSAVSASGLEAQAEQAAALQPQAASHRPPTTTGADFSSVQVHQDAPAQRAATQLHAQALTYGQHIYLGPQAGAMRAPLLAHELAHTRQQQALGRPFLQPRLIATGNAADIQRFIDIAEPAMGEQLAHDPVSGEVTAVASSPGPGTSPVFAAAMHRIIDDPANDAEAQFGVAQDQVMVGAFPVPTDMTGATAQTIDIDDLEAVEAGAPGIGIAFLAHELTENHAAHVAVNAAGGAVAGVDQFRPGHAAALQTEGDVVEDVMGPGRRVASVRTAEVAGVRTVVFDYENYYVLFDLTRTAGGGAGGGTDFAVGNARTAARTNVSTDTADGFATGSAALPATAAAAIATAAASVAANDMATVRIEGFTDDVGEAAGNAALGRDRANAVRTAMAAAGVANGRMNAVGRGQEAFVAPNDTEANRALNRRVLIVVDRPT